MPVCGCIFAYGDDEKLEIISKDFRNGKRFLCLPDRMDTSYVQCVHAVVSARGTGGWRGEGEQEWALCYASMLWIYVLVHKS